MPVSHTIQSVEELEALYGEPVKTSLIKELDHISDHYRAFIEAAPFCVVASCGPGGLDCSPRGDPAGFVRITDSKTVMLPDRRGNNRLDGLTNLIDNAVRYGEQVEIRARRVGESVEVLVEDDGPGIPPESIEDVFKPFYRLDNSRNPNYAGAGLGLAIARDVARSHGGDIMLQKSALGGLRAVLRLPV